MAETPEKTPADQKLSTAPAPPAGGQSPPPRTEIKFDDSKVVASYANFCRVTGTPEELIIDFGLNNQPMGLPTDSIPIAQRIIVNFFTAKRLLAALNMSVQRHEAAFGVLETDVQKRVQPSALRQAQTAAKP
jgi:hypothetical protein